MSSRNVEKPSNESENDVEPLKNETRLARKKKVKSREKDKDITYEDTQTLA